MTEEGARGDGVGGGLGLGCCLRRDTRGKRGYDGFWGAGVTEASAVVWGLGAVRGEIPAASAGMTVWGRGCDGGGGAGGLVLVDGVLAVDAEV